MNLRNLKWQSHQKKGYMLYDSTDIKSKNIRY